MPVNRAVDVSKQECFHIHQVLLMTINVMQQFELLSVRGWRLNLPSALLLSYPGNMPDNSFISMQCPDSAKPRTQHHFRIQPVQAFMASLTDHDAIIQFIARVVFGEPLALMQFAGNQMMERQRYCTFA